MVMGKRAALDRLLESWREHVEYELPRLDRIDAAMATPAPIDRREFTRMGPGSYRYMGKFEPTVSLPDDAPPILYELAWKAQTNYLPLLVRVFRQALRVDGYVTAAPPSENPWRWWQVNRLDARQVGLTDSALKYGASYAMVLPGDQGPAVRGYTPRTMTAAYADSETDEWPYDTVHIEGRHIILTDEETRYVFGVEDARSLGRLPSLSRKLGEDAVTYIEHQPHGAETCPVVRYRDSLLLDGEEQFGIVEPLLVLQQHMDETVFGKLVAQYFAAFKQRAVIGWVPESEAEELKAGAARIWYLDADPKDVRIDELSETDLTRYIDAGNAAKRDFAAIGQIPAGDLGVDSISNISDATLAGLERSKNNRAGEIALALGEGHEQLFRLMARLNGDMAAATDWTSEVRWSEREARTWAGQIDGIVKLVQAQVIGHDTAVDMVPGLTDQQVEQARTDARRERAASAWAGLADVPAAAAEGADVATVEGPDAARARFDALGIAIRAGVDPADAASRVGLTGVKFTGAIPVSLRPPADEAARLEDK